VGAPKGSHTTPPTNSDTRYNLPYGVVYNCPVNPGECQGFTASGTSGQRLYDNTGMLMRTFVLYSFDQQ